jgi:hypothetical protein
VPLQWRGATKAVSRLHNEKERLDDIAGEVGRQSKHDDDPEVSDTTNCLFRRTAKTQLELVQGG